MPPAVTFRIRLPQWVAAFVRGYGRIGTTDDERMDFVIALSRENTRQAGGPFAAAVFDERGDLVAPGVNMVEQANCSLLHAEIVAIALAQWTLGRYDLSVGGRRHYQLLASTEPCAMCFGAIPWSGVSELVCGARDADARSIGFDEGPKLPDWVQALSDRGITVKRDVKRQAAAEVLKAYASAGGTIYNAGGR